MSEKIAIASDHAGYELKEAIKRHFDEIEWLDLGTDSADQSVDYPSFGAAMGDTITKKHVNTGIIICGSGIGISIAANRYPSVRAALCTSPQMAKLAREHNNANVLALGSRITDEVTAFECVTAFFETEFEGGRHERRVNQLGSITTPSTGG